MAFVVREILGSRTTTRQTGRETARITFTVHDDGVGAPITKATAALAQLAATTPDPVSAGTGNPTTDGFHGEAVTLGTKHPDQGNLIASDYEIEQSEEEQYEWRITWIYRDPEGGDEPPGTPEPLLNIGGQSRGEFIDQWRRNPQIPPNDSFYMAGDGSWIGPAPQPNPLHDIGGTSTDSQGQPVNGLNRQQILTIQQITSDTAIFAKMAIVLNKRNSEVFLGAPPGAVVYLGGGYRRVEANLWDIGHEFVWDATYHARQLAIRSTSGDRSVITVDGNAEIVTWVQPFPETIDFETILGL